MQIWGWMRKKIWTAVEIIFLKYTIMYSNSTISTLWIANRKTNCRKGFFCKMWKKNELELMLHSHMDSGWFLVENCHEKDRCIEIRT